MVDRGGVPPNAGWAAPSSSWSRPYGQNEECPRGQIRCPKAISTDNQLVVLPWPFTYRSDATPV